jgi:hypothetical protein
VPSIPDADKGDAADSGPDDDPQLGASGAALTVDETVGCRPGVRAAQHRLQLSRPFAPGPVGGMMGGEPSLRLPGDLETRPRS